MKRGLIAEPRQRRWRLLMPVVLLVTTAATTKLAWDALTWEMDPSMARQLIDSPAAVDKRAAVVRLLRDCTASIAALQRVANSGDAEGAEQAKIALQHLHQATAR